METRTVELSIPADPANLDSEAKVGVLLSLLVPVEGALGQGFLPFPKFWRAGGAGAVPGLL